MTKGPERDGVNGDRPNFDVDNVKTTNAEFGVNPKGGYVTSWLVRNPHTGELQDVLYRGKWINRNGIPPLFPNFGKGGTVAPFHGVGMHDTSIWQKEKVSERKITMMLTPAGLSEEDCAAYPYNFATTITVETDDDGNLLYSMKIRNNGDRPMPIAPGIHPYWHVDHDKKGEVRINGIRGFNESQDISEYDWDQKTPDNAYAFSGKVEIDLPDKIITIELDDSAPGSSDVKLLNVWADKYNPHYDFNYLCAETITRGNLGIQEDPIYVQPYVEPEDEWEMRLKFSAKFKQAA